MRVAIVGSRDFPVNDGGISDFVHRLAAKYPDATVVSGAARGVDSFAANAATFCGLLVVEFPADWKRYGRSAGFKRNTTIVENADVVVAFWDGVSRGTAHTIELAKAAGVPVYIYKPRGA